MRGWWKKFAENSGSDGTARAIVDTRTYFAGRCETCGAYLTLNECRIKHRNRISKTSRTFHKPALDAEGHCPDCGKTPCPITLNDPYLLKQKS